MTDDSSNRKVVIAMDGSPNSDYAFDWYVENISKTNDEVIVVTCLDQKGCTAYMSEQCSSEELSRQLQEEINLHVALEAHIQMKLKDSGLNGNIVSYTDKPGEAIVRAAKENHASFIICGSRGQGKIRRTIMGSTSSYVLHHSDIPVIICKYTEYHPHHIHHHHHVMKAKELDNAVHF